MPFKNEYFDVIYSFEAFCHVENKTNMIKQFYNSLKKNWTPGTKEVLKELDDIVISMKEKQKNQEYDAIIGLSGGVDSSYLAYWATKEANLRLLAVHVDAGWNSDLAVRNIEEIVKKLDIYFWLCQN